LEAGAKWQAGALPYGYLDYTHRILPGFDLFGAAELHTLNDWRTQGGVRWER